MDRRVLAMGVIAPAILGLISVSTAPRCEGQCTEVTDKSYKISVSDSAVPTPDCVSVKKGKTTLTWQAGSNVKILTVAFKSPAKCSGADPSVKPPEDPKCVGNRCTLEKAKQSMKGTFCYSVVVVLQDGTVPQPVDPRLIIDR
jgi:hypothetical protein